MVVLFVKHYAQSMSQDDLYIVLSKSWMKAFCNNP